MMGYMRKDFLLMRKQMRTYGVIFLVYGAISAAGVWDSYILSGFVVLVTLMCPLSAMAFDQVSRWDSYAPCPAGPGMRCGGAMHTRRSSPLEVWCSAGPYACSSTRWAC